MWTLSCGMWDLAPWLGIKAGPSVLGALFWPPGKSQLSVVLVSLSASILLLWREAQSHDTLLWGISHLVSLAFLWRLLFISGNDIVGKLVGMLLFPLKQSRPVCLWAGIFWNISATDSRLPLPWCFLLQIVHHLYFIYLPLGLPNSQTARLWPLAWRLTLTCFPGVWCARNTTVVLLVLVLVVNFVHEHHELGFYPFVGNGRVYRESVWQFWRTSVASPSEALWVYMQVSHDTTVSFIWLMLVSHSSDIFFVSVLSLCCKMNTISRSCCLADYSILHCSLCFLPTGKLSSRQRKCLTSLPALALWSACL